MPSLGVTVSGFPDEPYQAQNYTILGLSDGDLCRIRFATILACDRRTDRRTNFS